MTEVNKGILDNDVVISAENVQKMGEVIALTCIKTAIVRSDKDLHYLYKGLFRDMNRSKDDCSPFSNAYDIAQEAMFFLCQHIGRNSATTIPLNTERSLQIKVLVIVVPTIICKSNTHATGPILYWENSTHLADTHPISIAILIITLFYANVNSKKYRCVCKKYCINDKLTIFIKIFFANIIAKQT